jgi:hypothetical protein
MSQSCSDGVPSFGLAMSMVPLGDAYALGE